MASIHKEIERPIDEQWERVERFEQENGGLVADAVKLAKMAHGERMRKDGSLYLSHVIQVGEILQEWGIEDENILVAAVLHDVVEDEGVEIEELRGAFGENVAVCVEGVSKYRSKRVGEMSREEEDRETLRKVVGYSTEPGVLLIKLADRLHNMRTMEVMSRSQKIRKARETMSVYVEMAEAVGLWQVKRELEDWCFYYLFPDRFEETQQLIENDERRQVEFTDYVNSRVEQVLEKMGIRGRVEVMMKGLWEAENKRERAIREGRNMPGNFTNISDIVSFRIILQDEQPEYGAMSLVALCKAVSGQLEVDLVDMAEVEEKRTDNYLVRPAVNGYRALHQVTRFNAVGPVEMAVTTESWERFNNWGVVSLMRERVDYKDRYERLKMVFTPTGKVLYLPEQATVLDVAARIDAKMVWKARGGRIDGGDEVGLTEVVPHGSEVRVELGKTRSWREKTLELCLPETRKAMEEVLIKEKGLEAREEGRKVMEEVLADRGFLRLEDVGLIGQQPESDVGLVLAEILFHTGCETIDELYTLAGTGFWSKQAMGEVLDEVGLSKELGWWTVRVRGKDRKGVLAGLTAKVDELGLNIRKEKNVVVGGEYTVIMVFEKMGEEQREKLSGFLEREELYQEVKIV